MSSGIGVRIGSHPDRASRARVIERFAVHAGQVTALLRLPLLALMAMIGPVVYEPHLDVGRYRTVLGAYALWSLAVVWWTFTRPVPAWAGWLTTGADLAALVVLAGASDGTTSYLQPLFYLLPIAVAFQYRPALTATVGILISGSYAAIWLRHLGQAGGPAIPGVVYLHFGLLLWLATATTTLTTVLVRRSAGVLDLLAVQRQLTAGSLATEQRERARIADELHDGALQNLIAARRNLEQLQDLLPGNALLAQSDGLLRDTAAQLRGTVSVLHPQVLAQLGLAPALRELAAQQQQRTGLNIHTDLADIGHTDNQDLLFSTARELLANAVKHARAANIWLHLDSSRGQLHLSVTDDGVGFDPAVLPERVAGGHIGLASHLTRITQAGGLLHIEPRTPAGTTATVHLALTAPAGHAGSGTPTDRPASAHQGSTTGSQLVDFFR